MHTLLARWLAKTDRFWDYLLGGRRPNRKRVIGVERLEDRLVPDSRPLPFPVIAAGSDLGSAPLVKLFDADTGAVLQTLTPFDDQFRGGVRVAVGDFTHDGYPDVVTAAGVGGGPEVRIFDGKTGQQIPGPLGNFFAYDSHFLGGVQVAAGDVNGDGYTDLVTAADAGGGPHVKVFDGKTGGTLASFFAFEPEFTGGVRLAVGDIAGTGKAQLILAAGIGGAPRVRVLDATTLQPIPGPLGDFYAFGTSARGGVYVASGDVTGDHRTDLVVGSGLGAAPVAKVFDGRTGAVSLTTEAFDPTSRGGVRVATAYVDQDAHADIVAGTGLGVSPRVRTLSGVTGQPIAGPVGDFDPGVGSVAGGVNVAAGNDPDMTGSVYGDFSAYVYVPTGTLDLGDLLVIDDTGTPSAGDFTVTIDWGDGTTSAGWVSGPTGFDGIDQYTFIINGSHTYTTATGMDPDVVSVEVDYAGDTVTGTVEATVDKIPTTTTASADATGSVIEGERYQLEGEVSPTISVPVTPTGTVDFSATENTTHATYALGSAGLEQDVYPVDDPLEAQILTSVLPAGTYTVTAHYSGDAVFLGSTGTMTLTVSPSPVIAPLCGCSTGVSPVSNGAGGGGMDPVQTTAAGVVPGKGLVQVSTPGLTSDGPGLPFGQQVSWSNSPQADDDVAGSGTTQDWLPHLIRLNGDDCVALLASTLAPRYFDKWDNQYHERGDGPVTLTHDDATHTFTATDGAGATFTLSDFSGMAGGPDGTLDSMADPAGNLLSVTSRTADGKPAEVQQSAGSGASAVTDSFTYAYASGGASDGLLSTVTQRQKVGAGSWETVRTEEYGYYDGTEGHGPAGTLRTAVVKDAAGNVLDEGYYRYTESGGTAPAGLMTYAFGPDAFARLTAALGTSLDSLSDAAVAPYADKAMSYDADGRVTTAVDAAAGCSACSGGLGTFTYTYSTNTSSDGLLDPNEWQDKTVETLPDGNQNTYYTNAFGQAVLTVYEDTTTAQQWATYTRYNAAGQVALVADPSAVTGFSESYKDLVNYGSSPTYLSASAGLISTTSYGTTTTATTSTAGDVSGFVSGTAVQQGTGGTPVPQSAQTYVESPAGTFVQATSTAYRNDGGSGAETTTMSYTWQGSTAMPASVTTTLPTVTTAENGPNTATSLVTVYDSFGRPEWTKDAGGFLTYTAYDNLTGAVVKQITDVNTADTGDFADLPSGWATPAGGGLELVTSYEVDGFGRATKETDPNGNVTYTVYDDLDHEVRTYAGWNSTTHTPTGPTTVTREDRVGNYTETLTMTAAPHLDGGNLPDGTEAIAQVQSLSRQYRNDAGQVVYSDDYFDLSGLAYSTSTTLGTEGTNFYRTEYGYDHQGRQNKVVSPQGTITRTEYDGRGRVVSEWVGTDDTPTTGYWSPTNLTGTDMVKVREYEYDGGGAGDGNVTKVTEYPGGGAAARVAQFWYDWRDRQVVEKDGVEATEATSVNRPIMYTDYDNLGEVTKTQVYDGDGVTITSTGGVPNAPSSSLLRAETTISYDELGRAYRQDTYDVDPGSGSVGSNTLYALTWYDSRGNAIKTLAPGGLVTKSAYDGAGRVTTVYTTDGGGDSGYADADDVTGDTVLEQVEYAYDEDGHVIQTTDRQRFHDASGTGALGSPSSGIGARVYYSGSYYDALGRDVADVDVGTNGGTAWAVPGMIPGRTDDTLVTSYAYAADAVQTMKLTGSPTGGTVTLSFGGDSTGSLAYNASASAVQAALTGLTSVGSGNAVVTDAPGGGWEVRFAGALAGKWQANLTATSSLTGGTSPGVSIGTVSAGGDAGHAFAATDPKGLVTRTYSDALGRGTQTVEDFTDGEITDTSNKTTGYTYNATGMTSLTAYLTGGGGQTTAYVYGVTTASGSAIVSNDIVGATEWPDPATGAASSSQKDVVTVNALGETVTSTDCNGTTHTLTYDVVGRVTSDAVTTLGSGVDGAVRRIETAYDGQGNPYLVTSYDAATGGNVVNQVQQDFNGLGQLTSDWQEHAGAVTGSSVRVQYAYTEMAGGANNSRQTSMTYPNGRVVSDNYASGVDDSISRLSSLSDSSATLEAYIYLGLDTIVERSHSQPGVDLMYIKQSGESNGDAGDQYTGLDRFGRVVDQRWIDTATGAATDRFQYGYDRDSNRTYRDNLVNAAFGEVYTYDGLNQISSFARGTLNGTKDRVTGTASRSQSWDYDAAGNFDSVTTDGTGQTRTANAQNEVTSVSEATTPTYDAAGNMTGDETGKQFVYDAWNRLVAVKDSGGTTLEMFRYDGLNRRVSQTASGTTTDLYYSDQWQVLEERVGGVATTQYVWSPAYVDALVERDRDTNGDGTLDERLYAQQDANWDNTALLSSSGVVQERMTFDSFGTDQVRDAAWDIKAGGTAYDWRVLFQGAMRDMVTGNDDRRRRVYDPALDRPIQMDPIRFDSGDVNFYRWEGNNPSVQTDPSGLTSSWVYIRSHRGPKCSCDGTVYYEQMRGSRLDIGAGRWSQPDKAGSGSAFYLNSQKYGGMVSNIMVKGNPGGGGVCNTPISGNPSNPDYTHAGSMIVRLANFKPGSYSVTIHWFVGLHAAGSVGASVAMFLGGSSNTYMAPMHPISPPLAGVMGSAGAGLNTLGVFFVRSATGAYVWRQWQGDATLSINVGADGSAEVIKFRPNISGQSKGLAGASMVAKVIDIECN
jgi:RHS repeat-associated protein